MTEIRIGGKYRLGHRIKSDLKYDTYLGINIQSNDEVAIRLEPIATKRPKLLYEAKLSKLFAAAGLFQVFWYGVEASYNAVVCELLGPTLQELLEYCDGKFSLKTGILVADQLI
jgi:hypothetical protein